MHCLMQLQFHGPKDHNYIYEVSVLVSVHNCAPTRRLACALHRENQIIMILDIKWPVGDTNHNPNRSYYHRNYAKF